MRDYFHENQTLRFLFPIDGDCLNQKDGRKAGENLQITAEVLAPAGAEIFISGKPARETAPGIWQAVLEIPKGRSTLTAENRKAPEQCDRIEVFRLSGAESGFRVSVDDNILFLADLTAHPEYRSLFDNPYLAGYRALHEETGVCVHLNLFYETGDLSAFSSPRPYFNLSMMTERFREEWQENSDWLRLSFHSRTEHPGRPYASPEPDRISADCACVHEEIIRFAGKETLSKATTVHFCACPAENVRALRKLGVRVLTGFTGEGEGVRLNYFYPPELAQRVARRHFWMDTEEQILCARIDSILNTLAPEELPSVLENCGKLAAENGFLEFMIHEQYFYPDYSHYIPEFQQMLLSACRFARSLGFSGRCLSSLAESID